jgi:energy-coupling factor transport system permease protein
MHKLRQSIHPGTWWLLGGTLALVAGSATNLVAPIAIGVFAVLAILIFRENATWTRSLGFYITLAGIVIFIRLAFRMLFSYSSPDSAVAFSLPHLQLNFGFGAIDLLGSVSWQSLYGALIDGTRLAAIILAVAIATTLANPRKLLKSAPGALYEIATSVSVAINLAPQLIESFNRVRRARQLRGRSKRTSRLTGIVIPVLEDTLDRSLLLAASMDARGFGRRGEQSASELLTARVLGLLGLLLNLFGIFILLSGFGTQMALALIGLGILSAAIGVRITSRRKVRTNLTKQSRGPLDYLILAALLALLTANFAGWLR